MKEPIFEIDKEEGTIVCIIKDKENTFIGLAECHEDDMDMFSELTGSHIAMTRAQINYMTHIRDNEIKPALKAMHHLSSCMKTSKNFNPKSYENIMLQRQIRLFESDLDVINSAIAEEKQNLQDFLKNKDISYKRIRAYREEENIMGKSN